MSLRKRKRRRILQVRRSLRRLWKSVDDRAWLEMRPVGREFGSPEYDAISY